VGPRAGLDAMAKGKVTAPVGNRTTSIQPFFKLVGLQVGAYHMQRVATDITE